MQETGRRNRDYWGWGGEGQTVWTPRQSPKLSFLTTTSWRIKMSQKIKINFFFFKKKEETLIETKRGSALMVRGISMSCVVFPGSRAGKGEPLRPCSAGTPTTTPHRHRLHRLQDNSAKQSQSTSTSRAEDPLWSPHCPEQSQGSPMGENGLSPGQGRALALVKDFPFSFSL